MQYCFPLLILSPNVNEVHIRVVLSDAYSDVSQYMAAGFFLLIAGFLTRVAGLRG